jgi:hypothetical protein
MFQMSSFFTLFPFFGQGSLSTTLKYLQKLTGLLPGYLYLLRLLYRYLKIKPLPASMMRDSDLYVARF